MKVKMFILLLAMFMVATSNSFAQASFETIDGIRYLIDSDAKTATVVPLSGYQKYSGDVIVPEKVKGSEGVECTVTAFGENAFKDCSSLTSITLPSSVTTLGSSCFWGCSGLTSIMIPSSVKRIDMQCFLGCDNIESVTLGLC